MHGHQLQRVVALAGLVFAGFERSMRQERRQVVAVLTGDLAVRVGRAFLGDEAGGSVDQFVEVVQPLLAFLLVLVVGTQAGKFDARGRPVPAAAGAPPRAASR
jgi:hypothetical protein